MRLFITPKADTAASQLEADMPHLAAAQTPWKRALRWLMLVGSTALMALLVLVTVVVLSLRPQAGEWAIQVPVRLPGLGQTLQLRVGVPSLIRLVTQPTVARALASRPWQLGPNTLQVNWLASDKRLRVSCTPCWLAHPALADRPMQLTSLGMDVHRYGESLQGQWWLGLPQHAVRGHWQARLSQDALQLQMHIAPTPIANLYAALAAQLPEARRATIAGEFSLALQLRLPDMTWQLVPELQGMQVSGLGTQALRQLPGSSLPLKHPLVRAVLAAEDQRFEQHLGYDLQEWQHAFTRTLHGQTRVRGASTVSQQLAKLLFTSGERTALRKLQELLYAVEMEQTLGKARILQLYLANAPWGQGVVGVDAAAQHYFSLPAARVSVAQSVWLAAMLNQPDRHAQVWLAHGHIDVARATWVAQQLRTATGVGLGPRQLSAVLAALPGLQTRMAPAAWPVSLPLQVVGHPLRP